MNDRAHASNVAPACEPTHSIVLAAAQFGIRLGPVTVGFDLGELDRWLDEHRVAAGGRP